MEKCGDPLNFCMRNRTMTRCRLLGFHVFVLAIASPALCFSQSVPLWALENWKLHNEDGLNALKCRKYDRAEQDFRQAIKEIQGYEPANRNLMARTYCDLARVFYHQEALRGCRAAGEMGPFGARRRQENQ